MGEVYRVITVGGHIQWAEKWKEEGKEARSGDGRGQRDRVNPREQARYTHADAHNHTHKGVHTCTHVHTQALSRQVASWHAQAFSVAGSSRGPLLLFPMVTMLDPSHFYPLIF